MLFAGRKVNVEHEMKRVVLDDWLKVLNVDAVTATLFKRLRVILDHELAKAQRDDDDEKEFTREDGNAEGSELLFKLVRDILASE